MLCQFIHLMDPLAQSIVKDSLRLGWDIPIPALSQHRPQDMLSYSSETQVSHSPKLGSTFVDEVDYPPDTDFSELRAAYSHDNQSLMSASSMDCSTQRDDYIKIPSTRVSYPVRCGTGNQESQLQAMTQCCNQDIGEPQGDYPYGKQTCSGAFGSITFQEEQGPSPRSWTTRSPCGSKGSSPPTEWPKEASNRSPYWGTRQGTRQAPLWKPSKSSSYLSQFATNGGNGRQPKKKYTTALVWRMKNSVSKVRHRDEATKTYAQFPKRRRR
eukprot:GHVQ01025108.1.p1 GENE.GHVQ01025108.1~~GHVQ01025108.1.p1  ORF type:complete len:269 (-),score=10.68 GHVQ01025108.1:242-1048(-)